MDPDRHRILYYHPALGQVYDDGEGQVAQVLDSEAHNAVIYSDDHGETWRWGGSSQGYIGSAARRDLTVRVSYDECRTWPVARRIDEDAGYSSLVVLGDGTILCGYGAWVCRFNLAWLEGKADPVV